MKVTRGEPRTRFLRTISTITNSSDVGFDCCSRLVLLISVSGCVRFVAKLTTADRRALFPGRAGRSARQICTGSHIQTQSRPRLASSSGCRCVFEPSFSIKDAWPQCAIWISGSSFGSNSRRGFRTNLIRSSSRGHTEGHERQPLDVLAKLAQTLTWSADGEPTVPMAEVYRCIPAFHEVRDDLRAKNIIASNDVDFARLSLDHIILALALLLQREAEKHAAEPLDELHDLLRARLEPLPSN